MKTRNGLMVAAALAAMVPAQAQEGAPRITGQDFAMTTAQNGIAGEFESLRVRVEAPARIASLLITQGDFETDLATTGDRAMFSLFGLDSRPLQSFDLTLDFAPYVNRRLAAPGGYEFEITVTDRRSRSATAVLGVRVEAALGDDAELVTALVVREPLRESDAMLRRRGAGVVEGVGLDGLTWITIEPVDVTLRIRPTRPRASLYELAPASWGIVDTEKALAAALAEAEAVAYIDIPAARRAAAGRVIALSDDDGTMLIRFTGSDTTLVPEGTAVTLAARVRRD